MGVLEIDETESETLSLFNITASRQYSSQSLVSDFLISTKIFIIINTLEKNNVHFCSLIQAFGVFSDLNQPIGFHHGTDQAGFS